MQSRNYDSLDDEVLDQRSSLLRDRSKFEAFTFLPSEAFALHPQSRFPRLAEVRRTVAPGTRWVDQTPIELPTHAGADRPRFTDPEDIAPWRGARPGLFLVPPSRVAAVGATASVVRQGKHGDCWQMASLEAVSRLGRVEECFTDYDEERGIYEVRLHYWDAGRTGGRTAAEGGRWQPMYVCVDRRIPAVNGAPSYSYSVHPGELWPSLLEKALAKAIKAHPANPDAVGRSGYAAMDGSFIAVGVTHLLGGSGVDFRPIEGMRWTSANISKLAEDLEALLKKGAAVAISFIQVSRKAVGNLGETQGPDGLVAQHAYPLVDVRVVQTSGKTFRLIQLRNPWGERAHSPEAEWRGAWSENDPQWEKYPSVARECGVSRRNEGLFWISAEDIAGAMESVEVAAPQPRTTTAATRSPGGSGGSGSPARHSAGISTHSEDEAVSGGRHGVTRGISGIGAATTARPGELVPYSPNPMHQLIRVVDQELEAIQKLEDRMDSEREQRYHLEDEVLRLKEELRKTRTKQDKFAVELEKVKLSQPPSPRAALPAPPQPAWVAVAQPQPQPQLFRRVQPPRDTVSSHATSSSDDSSSSSSSSSESNSPRRPHHHHQRRVIDLPPPEVVVPGAYPQQRVAVAAPPAELWPEERVRYTTVPGHSVYSEVLRPVGGGGQRIVREQVVREPVRYSYHQDPRVVGAPPHPRAVPTAPRYKF